MALHPLVQGIVTMIPRECFSWSGSDRYLENGQIQVTVRAMADDRNPIEVQFVVDRPTDYDRRNPIHQQQINELIQAARLSGRSWTEHEYERRRRKRPDLTPPARGRARIIRP